MKVLVQEWETDRGYQVSISKDREQLDRTIARLRERDAGEPKDEPLVIEIPDDHLFAKVVQRETVFVLDDERGERITLH